MRDSRAGPSPPLRGQNLFELVICKVKITENKSGAKHALESSREFGRITRTYL